MKIKFILFVIFIFVTRSVFAQKGIDFELVSSVQSSSIIGDYKVPSNSAETSYVSLKKASDLNFAVGFRGGYHFSTHSGLNLGIIYSKQGQSYKQYDTSGSDNSNPNDSSSYAYSVSRNVRLNYIKIPITYSYNTNPDKIISFSCNAGIYLGVIAAYRDKLDYSLKHIQYANPHNPTSQEYTETLTASGNSVIDHFHQDMIVIGSGGTQDRNGAYSFNGRPYKVFDLGASLGAGIQIKLSDDMYIPISVNYEIGFLNIKNESSNYTVSDTYVSGGHYYWETWNTKDPNKSITYHNTLIGLQAGLKIML